MTRWLAALLLVAAEGLFFSLAAQAYCSRPNKPFISGGFITSDYNMQNTRSDVRRYVRSMEEYVECLDREGRDRSGRERSDAEREVRRVLDEWSSAVSSHNLGREQR
jgi:hypothetical protein